jgi:hypothetical protein
MSPNQMLLFIVTWFSMCSGCIIFMECQHTFFWFILYEILKGKCEDNNYNQKFDSKQTDEMQFVIKQCEYGLCLSIFNLPF